MGAERKRGIIPFVETNCFICCPGFSHKKELLVSFANQNPEMLLTSEELAWSCLLIAIEEKHAKTLLGKWKASKRLSNLVEKVIDCYNERLTSKWSAKEMYQAGIEVISLVEQVRDFFGLENNEDELIKAYNQLPIKSMADLKVSGRDILAYMDKKPGPWLGRVLKQTEKHVVEGQWKNDKEVLLEKIKEMVG